MAAPVLWNIVEEHLEEAAFLWTQWQRALIAPNERPAQVAAGWEERLLAHLEPLLLVDPAKLLALTSERDDPEQLFALAWVLGEQGWPESQFRKRFDALGAEPLVAAVAPALGLCRGGVADRLVAQLARSSEGRWQTVGLGAMAVAGRSLLGAAFPISLFESTDPALRQAALRIARFHGQEARPIVEEALRSGDLAVRDVALETGLILGMRSAYAAARAAASAGVGPQELPLTVLAQSGDPRDLELLSAALSSPSRAKSALRALGYSGWPAAVDLCVGQLGDETLARLAGDAICAITGLVLAGELLAPPADDSDAPRFEEDDLNADLSISIDDLLPAPDPDLVESWWEREKPKFEPGRRYLAGQIFGPTGLVEALRSGPMHRRAPLALELAVRSRGTFQLATASWVRNQLGALATTPLESGSSFSSAFAQHLSA